MLHSSHNKNNNNYDKNFIFYLLLIIIIIRLVWTSKEDLVFIVLRYRNFIIGMSILLRLPLEIKLKRKVQENMLCFFAQTVVSVIY